LRPQEIKQSYGRNFIHKKRAIPRDNSTPLVLPQEGTLAFRVATQAVLIRGSLDELLGIRRAVRIVAAGASYFSFAVPACATSAARGTSGGIGGTFPAAAFSRHLNAAKIVSVPQFGNSEFQVECPWSPMN
jgi:hypothetical protein